MFPHLPLLSLTFPPPCGTPPTPTPPLASIGVWGWWGWEVP